MGIEKLEKINQLGEYTKYPGLAVIATTQQDSLWQRLYSALKENELLCKYYSLLPCESYHMTTCNLYTQAHTTGNWLEFVSDRLEQFQLQSQWLKEHCFNPTPIIKGLRTAGILQLELALADSQLQLIRDFADTFNLLWGVPEVFHITLAYNFKDILSQDEYDKIKIEFSGLTQALMDKEIQLNPPTLSYFNSMTAFTAWNGEDNPFLPPYCLFSSVLNFFHQYFPMMKEENRKKAINWVPDKY